MWSPYRRSVRTMPTFKTQMPTTKSHARRPTQSILLLTPLARALAWGLTALIAQGCQQEIAEPTAGEQAAIAIRDDASPLARATRAADPASIAASTPGAAPHSN